MLIPLSWTVSESVTVPEKESKRNDGGGWKEEGECVHSRDGEERGEGSGS